MKKLVSTMKAMADEPRMSILVVLALRGAVCVSHLQEAMRVPQPTVSRYLAILRNAGLLDAERRGQWVYYRLNEEEGGIALDIIRRSADQLGQTSRIKKVMERLDRIEQQPPLDEQISDTSGRSARSETRQVTRSRKHAVRQTVRKKATPEAGETAPEAEEKREEAEIQAAVVQEREDMLVVGIGAVLMDSEPEGTSVAGMNEKPVEVAGQEQAQTVSDEGAKKGRKREKKPQPPSLFDI